MTIGWDLIRTFETVAKTGSLSAAARDLQLTQPTIGRHIDLLEEKLQIPLFVRGREGMRLTAKGEDLVSAAEEMVTTARAFEMQATGLDEAAEGSVRLSANEIFGVMILPRLLPAFMGRHPGISIELEVSNSAANLLQRDADIALRMFRPIQNDLVARKIRTLDLGFYAHESYLRDNPAPQSLAEFKDHSWIGMDRDSSLIDVARAFGIELAPSDFAFRCDNILAHITAIRSGVGIGVTHQGLAKQWDDVDRVLDHISLPSLEIWIACHSEVRYNRRIRLVMDFLTEALRDPYGSYAR